MKRGGQSIGRALIAVLRSHRTAGGSGARIVRESYIASHCPKMVVDVVAVAFRCIACPVVTYQAYARSAGERTHTRHPRKTGITSQTANEPDTSVLSIRNLAGVPSSTAIDGHARYAIAPYCRTGSTSIKPRACRIHDAQPSIISSRCPKVVATRQTTCSPRVSHATQSQATTMISVPQRDTTHRGGSFLLVDQPANRPPSARVFCQKMKLS